MKRLLILFFLSALALASCGKLETLDPAPVPDSFVGIPVQITCAPLEGEASTRSSVYTAEDYTRVTDVNYYLFSQSGQFISQVYVPDASNLMVYVPDFDKTYRVFFIINAGKRVADVVSDADTFASSFRLDYGSAKNLRTLIKQKGFPMYYASSEFNASNAAQVTATRLTQEIRITIDKQSLSTTSMDFTSVKLRQAALDVQPFVAKSKAVKVSGIKDENPDEVLSADELETLNAGGTVTVYALENMRGNLLPASVTDWNEKKPSNLSKEESGLATFIEFTAQVRTSTSLYKNNTYRAYLGKSASNFDVERNTYFLLNNTFTKNMVVDDGWRTEADEPEIKETLEFRYPVAGTNVYEEMVPSNRRATESFALASELRQTLFVYRSNKNIEYDVTLYEHDKSVEGCPSLDVDVNRYNDNYDRLDITCNWEQAVWDRNAYDFSIKVESKDGLISQTLPFEAHTHRFPLNFVYRSGTDDEYMSADRSSNIYLRSAYNPCKLSFDKVTVSGTVSAYVKYLKHWYSSYSEKTQSLDYHSRIIANRKSSRYITPDYSGISIDVNTFSMAEITGLKHMLNVLDNGEDTKLTNSGIYISDIYNWPNSRMLFIMTYVLSWMGNNPLGYELYSYYGPYENLYSTVMKPTNTVCESYRDACGFLQISFREGHNPSIGNDETRYSKPKKISMTIDLVSESFCSEQPGLSYVGRGYSIFNYFTVDKSSFVPQYRLFEYGSGTRNMTYRGITVSYVPYYYQKINGYGAIPDWTSWSDSSDTNYFDFTVKGNGKTDSIYTVDSEDISTYSIGIGW